jgi:dTDP-4-dehydrorhamnose 3,5-epimerase
MEEPKILIGKTIPDDRGMVSFNNELTFEKIKRKYIVKNHDINFVRGMHAHKLESKWAEVIKGTAQFVLYKVLNWYTGEGTLPVRFILSDFQSNILYIPPGYANSFQNLTSDTIVQFYSSSTLEESKNDDYRFDYRLANQVTGADYWGKNYR